MKSFPLLVRYKTGFWPGRRAKLKAMAGQNPVIIVNKEEASRSTAAPPLPRSQFYEEQTGSANENCQWHLFCGFLGVSSHQIVVYQ